MAECWGSPMEGRLVALQTACWEVGLNRAWGIDWAAGLEASWTYESFESG